MTASIANSPPIVGIAILTAERSNGVRKPASMAKKRAIRFMSGRSDDIFIIEGEQSLLNLR